MSEGLWSKTKVRAHTCEDVDQGEDSFSPCGSIKLYSKFENQYGSYSESWEWIYFKLILELKTALSPEETVILKCVETVRGNKNF